MLSFWCKFTEPEDGYHRPKHVAETVIMCCVKLLIIRVWLIFYELNNLYLDNSYGLLL